MANQNLLLRPEPAPSLTSEATLALPANIAAEAAFLGAVLIDNRVIEELNTPLAPAHFFEPVHTRIYERICQLLDRKAVVTPVTLRPYFEADEALKELGGTAYLARLTSDGQGLLAPRQLAGQIYDLALLRELVSVGRNLVSSAMDTSESVEPLEQIEAAETALYKVAEGASTGSEAQSFGTATRTAILHIEKALNSGGHISGKTTGLTSLNAKIGGLHDSDLIILAARPAMGKTSLVTNIAFNTAERFLTDTTEHGIPPEQSVGAPVAFFSLEMSADQLATRILAEQSGISSEALRMGHISREEFQKLSFASQRLATLPLYIDDTPALTIAALRARARRLKRRHDIGLIVVDYLQLLQGTGRPGEANRVNEISEISRGLKALAKELSVPVIALSQLSRAVEQREDKRPLLSDLRESGSIEQDADMVWFIYRPEYYLREPDQPTATASQAVVDAHSKWQADMERVYGLAELIIGKQRHGSIGTVRLKFEAKITKFSDLAPEDMVDDRYD